MSDGYLCNGKTILCRADEANRFQSQADIDKPEVRVMVFTAGPVFAPSAIVPSDAVTVLSCAAS